MYSLFLIFFLFSGWIFFLLSPSYSFSICHSQSHTQIRHSSCIQWAASLLGRYHNTVPQILYRKYRITWGHRRKDYVISSSWCYTNFFSIPRHLLKTHSIFKHYTRCCTQTNFVWMPFIIEMYILTRKTCKSYIKELL